MHLDVIFSDEAYDMFESIGQQIEVKWGEKQMKEFRKRTYKMVEIISKFPLIF